MVVTQGLGNRFAHCFETSKVDDRLDCGLGKHPIQGFLIQQVNLMEIQLLA